MDTSETYIRMCEKAEKIQDGWNIRAGDYYVDYVTFPGKRFIEVIGGHIPPWEDDGKEWGFDYEEHARRSFWLPTQDRLQEMYRKEKDNCFDILADFSYWALTTKAGNYEYVEKFTSIEQLWLAFVMHEKYGQVWDGNDWQ